MKHRLKKLLIIGGSGLVGSTLVKYAKMKYDIHITINKNKSVFNDVPTTQIDLINDQASIIDLIRNFNPDIVVSTAAHSSVDFCEIDHKLANTLHVDAINYIAKVCRQIDAKLIFLSTDAVFNGKLIQNIRKMIFQTQSIITERQNSKLKILYYNHLKKM